METENKISALIQLLDDPDKRVFRTVNQSLLHKGKEIIPILEEAWEDSGDQLHQRRIENLIKDINTDTSYRELKEWISSGGKDLLKGSIIIASFQYPGLNTNKVEEEIKRISKDIWLEINDNLTALEKVRIINHFIFSEEGFGANKEDYFSPQNNFINSLVDSRKGNPVSLSILYSLIAQEIGIPIYGVNLPKNFVLAYMDPNTDLPLFFINPYRRGVIIHRKEIDEFLKEMDIEPNSKYYMPCDNFTILERLSLNLAYSYDKQKLPKQAELYKEVFEKISSQFKQLFRDNSNQDTI